LKDALEELPKATGKNVMRRILKRRAQPIADDAEALAPVRTGQLKRSIIVGTRLSRRQRRAAKETKSYVEIYVGPGPLPQAHMDEFGTSQQKPQPFLRPAWDAHKGSLLNNLRDDLWAEIEKAAERLARKAAKAKAKG
jgi:HK97 gp10 family phage protein